MSKVLRLINITQSSHLHCSCRYAQTRDFDLSNEKPCVAPSAVVVDADSGRVVVTSCEETWCHKARHRSASYRQADDSTHTWQDHFWSPKLSAGPLLAKPIWP